MKIIVINGQGGCGKDTFVGYCGYEDEGIYNLSMIDAIKDIAQEFGWAGGKELKDRKFLSDLKDLASEYNDFPFQAALQTLRGIIQDYKWHGLDQELICFIHARELDDIDRWVYDHGARALIIRRPEVEGEYGNHADDDVFEVEYDYEIWNDRDLYQLKERAQNFITQIKKEQWESNLNGKNN